MFPKAILLLTVLAMACVAVGRAASPRELIVEESVTRLENSAGKRGFTRRRRALGGLLSLFAAIVLACAALVATESPSDGAVRESASLVQRYTQPGVTKREISVSRPLSGEGERSVVPPFGGASAGLHRVRCEWRAHCRSRAPPRA